ncbi:TPA: hypothetical protein NIG95_001635 [Pseudomonas aeruginosa]|nr:hypothetical protein [Pseudomonas aeruginosa]
MSQTTTLDTLQTQAVAPRQRDKAPVAMSFFNMDGFELMQRIAKAFSNAQLAYDRAVDPLWDQPEPEPEPEDEEQEDDDGLQQ